MANKFKGVILDLDGVVTGTARVHGLAWESMFNVYLKMVAKRDGAQFIPFDVEKDYLEYVDGKPRMQGVKSFLESRGISLPFGDYDDSPKKETLCGLGNRKNTDFQKVLKKEGPDVFGSTIAFIKDCKKHGIKIGVASSSRNCQLILKLGKLEKYFETRVCGVVSRKLNLNGKPDPDIFVTAAANLGLKPAECVVIEDAISGVQAGKKGNFGLTLGIAREIKGETLLKHGADIVVCDMAEISVNKINEWFGKGIESDAWTLAYNGFDPDDEKLREALTTVGNGYMGTRGSYEGESASDICSPGVYIAGIYNKLPTMVGGKRIYNNDFVNCPNWTLIKIAIGGSDYISPLKADILSYKHSLDLKHGVMERALVFKDGTGRITRISSRRIASMHDPHLCAMKFDITPLNYSDKIRICSGIDGAIINANVKRYRALNSKHLAPVSGGKTKSGVYLHVQTTKSRYQIITNAKTAMYEQDKSIRPEKTIIQKKGYIAEIFTVDAKENTTFSLEKIISVFTSKDVADPKKAGTRAIAGIKSFDDVYRESARAWDKIWKKADIQIKGDRFMQKVARLHIYHLFVTASPHNKALDAGMTARGLHGEAYRGHIFWDELYILPFYNLRFPEISKALLKYRYKRLDGARLYARQNKYKGAMYPWQTADHGDEETQLVHYNPTDDSWGPDLSRRQRHVSIAVFYNVWRYVYDSNDKKFLEDYGAEIMIEIVRFWTSAAQLDKNTGKYSISGVMGPDEFHEKLPGSDVDGLKDNAYTNIMVVWLVEKVMEVIENLPSQKLNLLKEKIGFKITETEKWKDVSKNLNVVISDDGIISQFDGYFDLKDLDWDKYREKYGNIHRLDRILKAEGDSPDNYKLAKQADTLITFYVLHPAMVARILKKLGYQVGDPIKMLKKNYDYYEQRTSHGSTLSKVVHAVISGYMAAGDTAWDWFVEAMQSDIYDTQGGTTPEGIHCGVMAGTLDMITRYFAGIDFSKDIPEINPHLPKHWETLSMKLCHRNVWYDVELFQDKLKLTLRGRLKTSQIIKIQGKSLKFNAGKQRIIKFI